MKKPFLLFVLCLSLGALNAQTSNDEIDYIQGMFGMEKRAAVKEFIELEDSFADAFWENYEAYELIRKVYGKERIVLLDKFAAQFDTMSDQESEDWMKAVLSLRDRNEKLIKSYYKKILKECSPTVAMKFYQIESYILSGIRFQILENVPF
jgi:hypothetical protein